MLAALLTELLSRCALMTPLYASTREGEHDGIVQAIAQRDEALALERMEDHLKSMECALLLSAQSDIH